MRLTRSDRQCLSVRFDQNGSHLNLNIGHLRNFLALFRDLFLRGGRVFDLYAGDERKNVGGN